MLAAIRTKGIKSWGVFKHDRHQKSLDHDDCTVLFIQVGDDAAATRFLQSLDDELAPAPSSTSWTPRSSPKQMRSTALLS